jgi:hypothetical protein
MVCWSKGQWCCPDHVVIIPRRRRKRPPAAAADLAVWLTRVLGEPVFESDIALYRGDLGQLLIDLGLVDR